MKKTTPFLLAACLVAAVPTATAFAPLPDEPRRDSILLYRGNQRPGRLLFLSPYKEAQEAEFAAAIPRAQFLIRRGKEERRLPAAIRPATVGEALANWEDFHWACGHHAEDTDREALELRAADETLPHVWVVQVPHVAQADEVISLMLPGLGDRNRHTGVFEEARIGSIRLPEYYLNLESECVAPGKYRVVLRGEQPIELSGLDAALEATTFQLAGKTLREHDLWVDMQRQADGSWRASLANGEGSLRLWLDREATARTELSFTTHEGKVLRGARALCFTAELEGEGLALRAPLLLPSVYGAKAAAPVRSWELARYTTLFTPQEPYLIVSMGAGALAEGGRRELLYRCRHLKRLTARAYHVPAQGPAPVRVLKAYEKDFTFANELGFRKQLWKNKPEGPEPKVGLMQAAKLGALAEERELPLPGLGKRGHIDPTELVRSTHKHGCYIVELVGTPADGLAEGRPCVTQTVVQVTDLGLLWQVDEKGSLCAYAYRLSDSSPLPEARLHVLDAEGSELGDALPVKEGMAQGPLPEGACYVQLQCGTDAYTTLLRKDGKPVSAWRERPELMSYMVADKRCYGVGEPIRLRGFVRSRCEGRLSIPSAAAELRCKVHEWGGGQRDWKQPVTLAADGSFEASFTLPAEMGEKEVYFTLYCDGRAAGGTVASIEAQERPAASLSGSVSLTEKGGLRGQVTASLPDGQSLEGSRVVWNSDWSFANFTPAGFEDYRFGDYRPAWEPGHEFVRSLNLQQGTSVLDASGSASILMGLALSQKKKGRLPQLVKAELTATVSMGKAGCGLIHQEKLDVHPASLYVGLRRASRLSRVGDTLPLELMLVTSGGKRYEGAPVELEVELLRHRFIPCRYGAQLRTSRVSEPLSCTRHTVSTEGGRVELRLPEAGAYDIIVRGKDAEGNDFASAIRQYAWGGTGVAHWMRDDDNSLALVADKEVYAPGETARVLLATELEGQALITVEGAAGRRMLRFELTAAQRVVEVPLLPEDGETPTLHANLVQGAGPRPPSGLPLVQQGRLRLDVEAPARRLAVTLPQPPPSLPAGTPWEFEGQVRDHEGKPVPHATVLLFARDLGRLTPARYSPVKEGAERRVEQVPGEARVTYSGVKPEPALRDPLAQFRPSRSYRDFGRWGQSSYGSDVLQNWQFGNKGVFIGDNGAEGVPEALPAQADAASPIWERVTTDAEGRFRARFTTPDEASEFRLCALASEGVERFGLASCDVAVVSPLLLRAEQPDFVRMGDHVSLPLHLRLAEQPEGAAEVTRWRVSLMGQEGTRCATPQQEVELRAGQTAQLLVPVSFPAAGTATLTWRLSPVEGQAGLEGLEDTLRCRIPVLPAAQAGEAAQDFELTRRYERRLPNGRWQESTSFKRGDFVRVTLTARLRGEEEAWRPITAYYDALPTGWVLQTSYQRSRGSEPWLNLALRECAERNHGSNSPHSPRAGVLSNANHNCRGQQQRQLCYIAKVEAAGSFTIPPAHAELRKDMGQAAPDRLHASSAESRITVEP